VSQPTARHYHQNAGNHADASLLLPGRRAGMELAWVGHYARKVGMRTFDFLIVFQSQSKRDTTHGLLWSADSLIDFRQVNQSRSCGTQPSLFLTRVTNPPPPAMLRGAAGRNRAP
jgi:hypothetical protein